MPAFLRRVKRLLRPHSRQTSQTGVALESQVRIDRKDDEATDQYAYEDEERRDRASPSPPLPIIRDRGPPTANRYADADVFWNSVMIEADDSEKTWLSSRARRGRSNIEATPLPGVAEAGPSKQAPLTSALDKIQEEASTTSSSDNATVRKTRNDGIQRLERTVSYGKERSDNDLIVMLYATPEYANHHAMELRQQTSFPLLASSVSDSNRSTSIPLQNPTPVHRIERQPSSDISHEIRSLLRPRHIIRRVRNMTALPTVYDSAAVSSSRTSQESTSLTWNAVLSDILNNDAVDPTMKSEVRDRVMSSKTINGTGEGDHGVVSIGEAGLVPNFSRPVVGSPFFDRLAAGASPRPSPAQSVTRENDAKQEGQASRVFNHSLAEFDFGFDPPTHKLSLSQSSSSSLSSSTSSSSSDSLYRNPSPVNTDVLKLSIASLLSEVLTPSELNLCNTILATPINHSTADPQTRLTHALHTLIHHLQDRTSHLEDTIMPRLSTALQRKSRTIDALVPKLSRLSTQVHGLNRAIDFSNDVLAGCWTREYEMWSTLVRIRDGRAKGVWGWMRGREKGELMGREVEALVLMAEQNLENLREDVDDMVGMVEECLDEVGGGRDVDEGEGVDDEENKVPEGSWRDV
jgi:hypothetical protein